MRIRQFLFTLGFTLWIVFPAHLQADLPIERIQLPAGFQISLFSAQVPNARAMTQGKQGTIFVGSMRAGKVYAVRDNDQDGYADQVKVIAENLWMPVGVDFHEGDLYISEVNRISKLVDIEQHLDDPPAPVIVNDTFPSEVHHGWKFIRFGPDGKLYVPVGAPCNVCEKEDARFATIMRMNADGSDLQVFAKGIRNSVGFDWHPGTKELWFTDNGRDWAGDDLPPDELNYAPKSDLHFGFPYCHGGFFLDPEFGTGKKCDAYEAPAMKLGPHVAALGMRFYDRKMFPKDYHGQIFIAEHGSWNRSKKIGYRISLVRLEGSQAVSYETFSDGWLQGGQVWGRPADLLVLADGSMLVSDDHAGAIYRITYQNANDTMHT